ncbi:hypothetical protein [Microbacterium sp. EST19A]|uniref:hypothetical protein n=1 Tax=Microbacterium sp. EST19A TaxID=2862681 RepID=UPI001CBCE4D0|nr:hypothetical protein [Microbacterium sp. EST19A]
MTTRRWIAVGAVVAILLVAIGVWALVALRPADAPAPTASSAAEGPRGLTTEEAERLAAARFLAYRDGSRGFEVDVPTADGPVALRGRVDYRTGVGITTAALEDGAAVVTWDADTFVGWVGEGDGVTVPDAPPAVPGAARPLDPSASPVDAVLVLLASLGADRPENAQLLATSDAQWLRADEVGGVPVDVFAGPSDADSGEGAGTTRFWIDESGALLRFEADLPSGTVSMRLHPEQYVAVPRAPELG